MNPGRIRRALARPLRRATAGGRRLPDFLVLGAMRCGTTTLHGVLRDHPSVAVAADRKEVHFFDWNYRRGEAWYRSHFPRADGPRGALRAGEVTPSYLFYPSVPARVAGLLPEARFVVLLRDPVDRAYSHYQKSLRAGRETLSFEDALAREEARLAGEAEKAATVVDYKSRAWIDHSYAARGRYAEQIRRWFAAFPRDRFLFLESGELFRDLTAAAGRVFAFLGVEPAVPAAQHRSAGSYAPMASATRSALAASFRPHNEALYELLGQDFGWGA